jgi:hypothetical protein
MYGSTYLSCVRMCMYLRFWRRVNQKIARLCLLLPRDGGMTCFPRGEGRSNETARGQKEEERRRKHTTTRLEDHIFQLLLPLSLTQTICSELWHKVYHCRRSYVTANVRKMCRNFLLNWPRGATRNARERCSCHGDLHLSPLFVDEPRLKFLVFANMTLN